jgi:predicted nuclease of predicted toxin-antitoxin system
MSVCLLLNGNFPAPAVAVLREAGYDALAIAESLEGIADQDQDVLALAVREQRWLVTFDRDYGDLLFARKLPAPPAVILLRVSSYRPAEPAAWIIELIRNRQEYLGKFIVFDGNTLRTRPLLREIGDESA